MLVRSYVRLHDGSYRILVPCQLGKGSLVFFDFEKVDTMTDNIKGDGEINSRRGFLKTAGNAGAIAVAGATGVAQAGASLDPGGKSSKAHMGPHQMPKGMTLLSIRKHEGDTLGVKTAQGILDVQAAAKALHMHAPVTMDEMLQEGSAANLQELITAASKSHNVKLFLDESKIAHGRLFQNPGKIICIGLNYREHAAEANEPVPRVPILFNKYNNALNSHNCTIKLPTEVSTKFDYEVELLVVIGKRASNVSQDDALNYVAGYCTSNDFSSRDLQTELDGKQWMLGKTLDGFGPIGPYFVSADLVPDPNKLNIECRVNGETRQKSNTSFFVYNVQYVISYISKHFALEPGDIIFTGTPSGVILGYPKEKQVWLKAGDKIACSVGNLGELKFDLA
jgi:2-keto-4-pentenoate hydratase/2-oxohepta-3-ene-1,7-dioic acid hydratase in catechol pathway